MSRPCSENEMHEIRLSIFAGRKIEAIKRYRECSGAGLKDAKDFVDALEVELRQNAPQEFSQPASSGCFGMLLLMPLVAWALWYIA